MNTPLQTPKSDTQVADLFGIPIKKTLLEKEARLTKAIALAKADGRDMDAVEHAAQRIAVRDELAKVLTALERTKTEKADMQKAKSAKPSVARADSTTAPANFSRVDVLA